MVKAGRCGSERFPKVDGASLSRSQESFPTMNQGIRFPFLEKRSDLVQLRSLIKDLVVETSGRIVGFNM